MIQPSAPQAGQPEPPATMKPLRSPGQRLAKIPPSGTMEVGRKVRALRGAGVDVIHLGAGSPTPSPEILSQPFSFDPASNTLGDPAGTAELRAAIARKLQNDQKLTYDPASEIILTIGAKQGLYAVLLALIEPGDEVAILDPAWVTYGPSIMLAGGIPKPFSLDHSAGYRLDAAALADVLGPRTAAIVINTPHNPTGRVFSPDELQGIADLAARNGSWVICDESFDKFVFDGRRHVGIASLPDMRDRTVVLQSFSKAYGFIGGRIGYLAAPACVAGLVRRFNEHVLSCVSPFLQSVALGALGEDPGWTARLQAAYQDKRDLAVAALRELEGFACDRPEGTFYVWANISAFGKSSEQFASDLLDGARVAVTPGSAFGAGGEGFIRFNLAGPTEPIEEGLRRIGAWLNDGAAK